jgi:alpha-L-rhamnosidase
MTDAAPAAPASRIGLDSTLAAVIDDLEAYEAVGRVLEAVDPEKAHAFRTHTRWSSRRELGEALFMHAGPETQQEIAERLAALSARREKAHADA